MLRGLCGAVALSCLACGEVTSIPIPDAAPLPSVAGTWQILSGDLYQIDQGFDGFDFIELTPTEDGGRSGSGELFASSAAGLIGCTPLVYSELGPDAVSLSAPQISFPDLRVVEHLADDRIALTDATGERVELVRVDAVPDSSRCPLASVVSERGLPVSPNFSTGLPFDGTRLWFEGNDNTWIPFNPATGGFEAAIPANGVGQFTHIHASQGALFWTHCNCGRNETARLIDPANQTTPVQTVDTAALGAETLIRGLALDDGDLVISGNNLEDFSTRILVIDLAGPSLTSTAAVGFAAGPLATRGLEVWGQVSAFGQNLIRFDPEDGQILETIKLPLDLSVRAFSFVGDQIFVVGQRGGADLLVELSIP